MTRSCLLPIFIWPWLIVSVFGMVLFTAGIFDLPFYYRYVPDLPMPVWGPPAYALVCLGYFISIIAILSDNEWGLPLFVTATIGVVAIELNAGLPVSASIQVMLSVVVLIILLGLDEWEVKDEGDLKGMHAAGLAKEAHRPSEALTIYKMVEEKNTTRSLLVLFAGIICLPMAYLVSYFVDQQIDQYQAPVAIAIMCLLGMGPIVFLSARRFKEKNKPLENRAGAYELDEPRAIKWFMNIWFWAWMLVLALFSDAIQMVIMGIIAGLIIITLLLPLNLWLWLAAGEPFVLGFPIGTSAWIEYGLTIPIFLLVFLIVVSEVRLRPFSLGRLLRDLPAGLKLNSEKIFSFLTNVSLTVVLFGFVSVRYDLVYSDIKIGVILYMFLGALIGWDLYREERDVLLGTLNTIAQARCLRRIGEKNIARVFLYRALDRLAGQPEPYKKMAEALNLYFQEDLIPEISRRELRKGERKMSEFSTPYYEFCRKGNELTALVLE